MIKTNKIFWIIILAVIAGGLLLVQEYYWGGRPQGADAYEFNGQIEKVSGDTIYMKGNYSSPAHPEWAGPDNAVSVRIKVASDTDLIKVIIYRPRNFDPAKFIDVGKLRQEVMLGSIDDDDLVSAGSFYTVVRTETNIYRKTRFTAEAVNYYVAVDSN